MQARVIFFQNMHVHFSSNKFPNEFFPKRTLAPTLVGPSVFPDARVISERLDFQYFQIDRTLEFLDFQYFQVPIILERLTTQHSYLFHLWFLFAWI